MLIEIIIVLAFVMFAAVGMADAAEWLMRVFYRSPVPCSVLTIVPIKEGDADGIETRVRGILAESCWEAIGADCRVLLVDCGVGLEERLLCERLSFAFDGVEYIAKEELGEKASLSLQNRQAAL